MNIHELLKLMVERGASDLHLKVGNPPVLRINGALHILKDFSQLSREVTVTIASQILNKKQKAIFNEECEVDFAYSVSGLGRFRCNAFLQRGSVGIVFRSIPMVIKSVDELGLPLVLNKIALEPRGLILVTGITGSGKSTTLAAMIQHINQNRDVHIITIEDPIEYIHHDQRALINQREIGADAKGFSTSLRSALRQDPDVILVGEMRDKETIETAITAAETGHLVMSTLHTSDAMGTINRIISMFPAYQQGQIRLELAEVLKASLSMRLVRRKDGKGRVPAVEVLVVTDIIRQCILEAGKTLRIPEYIEAGRSQYGMQSFDQALFDLFQRGLIVYEEALLHCTRPADFALKVKGIQSTEESIDSMKADKDSQEEAPQDPKGPGEKAVSDSEESSDSMFTKY
ncbi:type IV pili twitching motility protein PilT [candidate division KSB3 bacterium]|uniref:Type IV pili twitching motility protein PilT n=1 Tax=candidate division KSB3 bacterium TaxID=2044937 RepID=A0A2G6E372_9BACT|nr:MAG: type IV pili twitching motility protein PilT [candidate division KSB3 bacterium]PIE28721.1 MAG: type IV pili twitching motility protein PilT [candidate division KSB3 bacterium]